MANTVCIAALCQHAKPKYSVIICSDARMEFEGLGAIDIPYKAMALTHTFSAMFSGEVSRARELIGRYVAHLGGAIVTKENVLDELRAPLSAQHRAEVAAYVSYIWGITYEAYEKLSQTDRQSAIAGFQHRQSDLLLAWLSPEIPRIFAVSTHDVYECAAFGAIGVGASAATSSLLSRKYDPNNSLAECIYHAYEAKRSSEEVPGVGKTTYLTVLEFDHTRNVTVYHPFGHHSLQALEGQYAAFGPKRFSPAECPKSLDLKSLLGG